MLAAFRKSIVETFWCVTEETGYWLTLVMIMVVFYAGLTLFSLISGKTI